MENEAQFHGLWASHLPMIERLCREHAMKFGVELDLMRQAARVALASCIRVLRDRAISFSAYFRRACCWKMLDWAMAERGWHRNRKFQSKIVSLDEPADPHDPTGDLLGDCIPYLDPPHTQDERDTLQSALAELPAHYRDVLEAFYFSDMTLAHIAEERGISGAAVSRQHRRALSKLRRKLKNQFSK